jgi:four helix bundle protein
MFNFAKLDVWREAVDFAETIYRVTRAFPDEERFGLTSQMRRAAVSISSNIAEGSSRSSRLDFARYIELAARSVFEVVSQSVICNRQGYISKDDHSQLYAACEKQSRMLSCLKKSLLKDVR